MGKRGIGEEGDRAEDCMGESSRWDEDEGGMIYESWGWETGMSRSSWKGKHGGGED